MQPFILFIFVLFSYHISAQTLEDSRLSMAQRLHNEMEFLSKKASAPTIYKYKGTSRLAKRESAQFLNLEEAFEEQDIVKSGLAAPKRAHKNDELPKKPFSPKLRAR